MHTSGVDWAHWLKPKYSGESISSKLITKKISKKLEIFQNRHLRNLYMVFWPIENSNTELYNKTLTEAISLNAQRKR